MTKRRIGEAVFVFGASFLLYAIISPGDVVGDTEIRWDVARSIVEHGGFDIAPGSTQNAARGRDGKYYSFYGPGQSLLMVPAVAAGRVLMALHLPLATSPDLVGQFIAALVLFPLFGAGAVVMLYGIVWGATGDRRAARWLAVILAVATMHWQYSVNTYEESQIAFFLLAAVWAIQRLWSTDRVRYLLLAWVMMGASLSFRASSIVVLLPVAGVGLAVDLSLHGQRRLARLARWVLLGVLCLGPFVIALGAYNFVRFGSPLQTGYGPAHTAMGQGITLFSTPWVDGLGGLLLSPGKSVFLYNPVLLLAILGLAAFWKAHRGLAMMVIAAFAATVLFHSKFTFWSGDLAWGPRYLA
ncbi:MAG: glycosyltransferase family 39 protein, partial [Phycisphaerae bacterium]|nr:glycosyltransferase family 39 protein [Phycisphaerae bacterium]